MHSWDSLEQLILSAKPPDVQKAFVVAGTAMAVLVVAMYKEPIHVKVQDLKDMITAAGLTPVKKPKKGALPPECLQ